MADSFRGIFPALVTPMTRDEEIDCAAMEALVNRLIEQGVHGVIPLGSTGEYYALNAQEREDILTTTLDAADGRVPVVAGTNAGSTREAIGYCLQAERLGAAGVLLAAPYYSLPTQNELFEHFRAVAESISIPIMLYNYPGRTGVDMTVDLIERLAELDRIQYVKESSGNVSRIGQIIRRCGEKITVFCGCDTAAFESFVLGAAGWVGGVVNILPKQHVELFRLAVREGDIPAARDLYYKLLPVLDMMESGKYTQFVKAGCQLAGHPVGPPRPPLLPATPEECATLKQLLSPLLS